MTLGGRPGNGEAVLFLPCERGSRRHTAVVTRPRLRLALELILPPLTLLPLWPARGQKMIEEANNKTRRNGG